MAYRCTMEKTDKVKVSPLIKAEIIDKPSIQKKIEDTNKQYYT